MPDLNVFSVHGDLVLRATPAALVPVFDDVARALQRLRACHPVLLGVAVEASNGSKAVSNYT